MKATSRVNSSRKRNGKVIAVCVSDRRGVQKKRIGECEAKVNHGLVGDAHAGDWHRQISLLADESADVLRRKGIDVEAGGFGENLRTVGIELKTLPIGTYLKVGDEVLLRVTQIGKECHDRCAIYYQAGDCVMPREGIFTEVVRGGVIREGDTIEVVSDEGCDNND